MKIIIPTKIEDAIAVFTKLANSKDKIYVTNVTNSGRRKLSRNLKPILCEVEMTGSSPNAHHYNNIDYWLSGGHIKLITLKGKTIKIPNNMDKIEFFTTYEEAVNSYNEQIEASKAIFYDIINYRESLKIKKK
jgi:hypothetical protein